jgi:thioredoxin-like negative regulator of GroEL
MKNYAQALPLFLAINQSSPANSFIMMNIAKCLFELGKYSEAKSIVNDLLTMLPEHEEAAELLVQINAKLEA